MKNYINSEFDAPLSELKARGLVWFPWVGRLYSSSSRARLLIVGETHYCNKSGAVARRHVRGHRLNVLYTRGCIFDYEVAENRQIRTFQNMKRALVGQPDVTPPAFWQQVAYYNFVQREMICNGSGKQRPNGEDFFRGWAVFLEVAKVLRPTHCVFIGVSAFASFEYAMEELGLHFSPVERRDRIGRTEGRVARITDGGRHLQLIGIQHPGKFFSWERWHTFLSQNGGLPRFLNCRMATTRSRR